MSVISQVMTIRCDACGTEGSRDSVSDTCHRFDAEWDWTTASGQWCGACKRTCVICMQRVPGRSAWAQVPGIARNRALGPEPKTEHVTVCAKCCEGIEDARRARTVTRLP